MTKKSTTEEFVSKARLVHGYKYDYSKVEYINSKTKVCLVCPIHGEFWQRPNDHLHGKGCRFCSCLAKRSKAFGVGDYDSNLTCESENEPSHRWRLMLGRCYNKNNKVAKTYRDCEVCDEWKTFSNFKKWFDEHSVDDWCIDKDILFKGNRVYSPQTCCFVPNEINVLFTKRQSKRGAYPIGVTRITSKGELYQAHLSRDGRREYLGCFGNVEDAFSAYKQAKESYIKEVADKWKDKLEPRVYEALCNYKVEITD